MAKRNAPTSSHNEWLSLLDIAGPPLSSAVLDRVFPHGLPVEDDADVRHLFRANYEIWTDSATRQDPRALQADWFDYVMGDLLGMDDEVLTRDPNPDWFLLAPHHAKPFRPTAVVINPYDHDPPGAARMFVSLQDRKQHLGKPHPYGGGSSPKDLMLDLCRHHQVPLGLVTNGDTWVLVHAPRGENATLITFQAAHWQEEPLTLRAFMNLARVKRFFGVPLADTLPALFRQSADNAGEVTDLLGQQVREAVEILVHTLERIDVERKRQFLAGIHESRVYEAALTVMMRLVLMFCAEERELFPKGVLLYDRNYRLSSLRADLRALADQRGEEVLERHCDAWFRLLATFRMAFAGVDHEEISLPAYGSNLFDPDRFPFLEGRAPGSHWRRDPADPPRVDNRTVLHLLDALQVLQLPKGLTRPVSFSGLDPEQIGHIYEGLLDHTAKRAEDVVLGLVGTTGKGRDMEPELSLSLLADERAKGETAFVQFLKKETGKSEKALIKAAAAEADAHRLQALRGACHNRDEVLTRVLPFAGLIRNDSFGTPFIVMPGGVYVTNGTDRRSSGSHYTPRHLSEEIVTHALDPLVYHGPAEGLPEKKWTLHTPEHILGLKICDPAMGSGAFLVQACRYLADKLTTAWEQRMALSGGPAVAPFATPSEGGDAELLIPDDPEERLSLARRLICLRCLYGVDKNPMAVEMAKLSLWLITLDPKQPFTFLDHHLRHGDSLLGLTHLDQLRFFHLDPQRGIEVHKDGYIRDLVKKALDQVVQLRRRIEWAPARDMAANEAKELHHRQSERLTARLKVYGDLIFGAALQHGGKQSAKLDAELVRLAALAKSEDLQRAAQNESEEALLEPLRKAAAERLGVEPLTGQPREPFHWVLDFPEVFLDRGGFDALVGNPPFLGGQKLTGLFGKDYREYLVHHLANGNRGSGDLCAYFFLRAEQVLKKQAYLGFIATNTIAQGATREIGLGQLESSMNIYRAFQSQKWPGFANLEVSMVWASFYKWKGAIVLEGEQVNCITSYLSEPGKVIGDPFELMENKGKSFQGAIVLGLGFVLETAHALSLLENDSNNSEIIFPYLNGEDLTTSPTQSPERHVINFFDWPCDHESAPEGYHGYCAVDFKECFEIVEEKVRPDRLKSNRSIYRKYWWQYAEKRKGLNEHIEHLDMVLVSARVSKYSVFHFIKTGIVMSEAIVAIASESYALFANLQSSFHEPWARKSGSSLETRLRYTPSTCFETYPFPPETQELHDIGRAYHDKRAAVMLDTQLGLTKTYNRFHDQTDTADDIQSLRDLHKAMDQAVARAYGWDDLDLGHGYHDTKHGQRFTLAPAVVDEVMDRLLALNHQRHAEEQAQAQFEAEQKAAQKKAAKKKTPAKSKKTVKGQSALPGLE